MFVKKLLFAFYELPVHVFYGVKGGVFKPRREMEVLVLGDVVSHRIQGWFNQLGALFHRLRNGFQAFYLTISLFHHFFGTECRAVYVFEVLIQFPCVLQQFFSGVDVVKLGLDFIIEAG